MSTIIACTSIRSDYDLMQGLYSELNKHHKLILFICGAHLSTVGATAKYIHQTFEGHCVEIHSLPTGDTCLNKLQHQAKLTWEFGKRIDSIKPALTLVVGDREDALALSTASAYLEVPSIHFYGGDYANDANVDNLVRNAISKLSTYHMVAHPHHQQRLVALGESPENIFLVGSVALDRIVKHTAHTKAEIEKILGVNTANRPIALFTFHPITGEREITERIIENTFKILLEHGYFIFANTPNTDPGSQRIRSALTKWKDHLYTHLFESLPNDLFLSLLKNCSLVIGNSSLGIYEAATIPVAVINIGLRQKERATSPNVVFISSEPDELNEAIKTIRSEKFKAKVKSTKNCYGDGNSVQKAVTIITQQLSNKEHNFSKLDPLLLNHEKEYINATGKH